MQLKRGLLAISAVLVLCVVFYSPLIAVIFHLCGTEVRGLRYTPPNRLTLDLYEEATPARFLRVEGLDLVFREGRVQSLTARKIIFEDRHRPRVSLAGEFEKLTAADTPTFAVDELSIARLELMLSASSAPIIVENLKISGLELSRDIARVASFDISGRTVRKNGEDVSVRFEPEVFADLHSAIDWKPGLTAMSLKPSPSALEELRRKIAAQSQP